LITAAVIITIKKAIDKIEERKKGGKKIYYTWWLWYKEIILVRKLHLFPLPAAGLSIGVTGRDIQFFMASAIVHDHPIGKVSNKKDQ